MKKIIMSLAMIAAVGALVAGATRAFFSDTETSVGNTFTAGTIDIAVGEENPWTTKWENYLDKPSQVNYMNFTINNVGENPANVWKRLTNIVNGPGIVEYCDAASSEPEWFDGGGLANCEGDYVERDNLSAFMIYDMAVCLLNTAGDNCKYIDDGYGNIVKPDMSTGWTILVNENDQIRVDNVVDTWIKLADNLGVDQSLLVSQSYHLMTWDDSGQPMITNWAQGDVMTFDIELDARQITAPAPGTILEGNVVRASANLVQKNTTTWDPIDGGANGTLTYDVSGPTFKYDFSASNVANGNYRLIYYPDPWSNPKQVFLIGDEINVFANVIDTSGDVELGMDLPTGTDANFGVGAKVWLVPSSSLSGTNLSWSNINEFLFDLTLVNYDDTEI